MYLLHKWQEISRYTVGFASKVLQKVSVFLIASLDSTEIELAWQQSSQPWYLQFVTSQPTPQSFPFSDFVFDIIRSPFFNFFNYRSIMCKKNAAIHFRWEENMLYVIGDLHLSFESSKPMDIFGKEWENHAEKLKESFSKLNDDDVTVICGDLTWGMDMNSCLEDFRFIDDFPGKKIILKGNHDFWWTTASKTRNFFSENNINSIEVLNNNCYFYKEIAICGTRNWFCPNENPAPHDKKIMQREILRLETSLKSAGDAERKICFLHYPPIYGRYYAKGIIELMHDYGVKECYFGHIHGPGRFQAFEGKADGIEYKLISADHIGFAPIKIA